MCPVEYFKMTLFSDSRMSAYTYYEKDYNQKDSSWISLPIDKPIHFRLVSKEPFSKTEIFHFCQGKVVSNNI